MQRLRMALWVCSFSVLAFACSKESSSTGGDGDGDGDGDSDSDGESETTGGPIGGSDVCDAYIACLGAVSPDSQANAQEEYGEGGACWLDPERDCNEECHDKLQLQHAMHDDVPECEVVDPPEETEGETEGEKLCGEGAAECCGLDEECVDQVDCCDQENHTCYLDGVIPKCIDLAARCEMCLNDCPLEPEICEGSCAQWCNPP